jgi:V/A-type H+-transporting ATPase subunit D
MIACREQVRIASDGVRLLKSKRDALLREFLDLTDTVLSTRNELEVRCREGTNTLTIARSREGVESLRSAAFASRRTLPLEITERRVWGIPVPQITSRSLVRSPEARGYSLPRTGVLVDETAAAFEKILHQALLSAMEEVRLRRIGEEIRKTNRRVNALEQLLLPSLSREIEGIRRILEERAREDVYRLKKLKAKNARPGVAGMLSSGDRDRVCGED